MNQRIVSLGGNCMLTMEVRKFFGIQAANLFDWWITPGDALVLLVENDFAGLFSRRESQDRRRRAIGCQYSATASCITMIFCRNEKDDRVVAIEERDIQRNLEKFAYLKRRWDDLAHNRGPVLFVRWAWNIPEPLLAGIPPGARPRRTRPD